MMAAFECEPEIEVVDDRRFAILGLKTRFDPLQAVWSKALRHGPGRPNKRLLPTSIMMFVMGFGD